MSFDDVAIVILNYKTWQDTIEEAQLVHDLFNLNWKQIIIVDNASPNESEKELSKKLIGDYIFIETGENKGYAAGNNVGLKHAYENGYKYGWILNNDITMNNPNVLSELLKVFSADSSIAVVNPDVYSPDGHLYNRDVKRMTLFDFTIGILKYKQIGRTLQDLGGYGYVYRPQGCCMLLDLEKLNQVGYMDENTFLYCEELILAEKLQKYYWKCACVNKVKIIHNHSKTVKSVLGRLKTLSTQNKSFNYYLKEYRNYKFLTRAMCIIFYSAKNSLTN